MAGIAKHVGFPAAPEINGLKQNEIDGDLRAMGVSFRLFFGFVPIGAD